MTAETLTLSSFLLARIAEDEAWARLAQGSCPSPWWQNSGIPKDRVISAGRNAVQTAAPNVARFIARHDPARVLAECAAKKAIVESAEFLRETPSIHRDAMVYMDAVLAKLAAVYSDHPEFREEWRA